MASVKQQPNGRYRARYRDAAGKEHARHFKLKREAQRWLDEVTTTKVTGLYVDPHAGKITFNQWFKQWSALQVWEAGTLEAAERAVKGIPFGATPLQKITAADVQAWVKAMDDRGLAASTIRTRYNYVHMCLRAAVGERIPRDPSATASRQGAGVRLPRVGKTSATLHVPTVEQMAAIHDGAHFYFRSFIAACAFAGLRLGEAAGLQLGDLDLEGRGEHGVALHVQRQIQGQVAGQTRVVAPKYLSDRWVPIPAELGAILVAHVEQLGTLGDEGFLFTPDGANVYNRNSAGHQWRHACKVAGVEGFTLHSARHFYASGLIAAGCDVVTVQRALGHSSPTITLDTYSHLWPNANERTRTAATGLLQEVLDPADKLRTLGLGKLA